MHQLATAIDIPGEKDRQISGLHCVGVEAGNAIGVHFNAGFRQAEPVDIRSTTERGQHKFHIGTAIVISLHHDAAVFALNGAKAALAEFDKIGKAAKASGLNAESFQELAHAAELGGVNFEQFSQAMNAFNRNAGMAAIGKGELVEKLKQLNPELLKSIQSASTQAERIRLVADALDVETDASRKAAIASAVFGDAGVRMVEVLKGGSAALDETARKARSLGLVVDSHLIARAETLNDEFATATRIIDLNFKQALVNLAPVLATIAKATSILAGDIRKLVDSMLSLENQSNISLEAQMRSLGLERLDVEKRILELRREQDGLGYFDAGRRAVIEQAVAGLEKRMAGIAAEEQKIMQVLEGRNVTTQPPPPNLPPPDPTTRDRAAEAALREAEAIQRLIDDLAHELSLINESDLAKAQANALRQAGANATESQRQQILNLVAAIHEETAALQKNEAAQKSREQSIQAMFKMGEDALISMIDNSLSAEEILKRLVVQLAAAIAQAALLGTGPLAGIFGGGLFKADGGAIKAASGGLIRGPGGPRSDVIPAMLSNGEFVVNAKAARQWRGLLEQINSGMRIPGFQNGGFALPKLSASAIPSLPQSALGEDSQVHVVVSTKIDKDGQLRPFVESVSRQTASATVTQYDRDILPTRWHQMAGDPRRR